MLGLGNVFSTKNLRPDRDRQQSLRRSSIMPSMVRRAALQLRLEEVLVFEIHKDGSREYRTMTLRALYNHVLKAIATRPRGDPSVDVSAKMLKRARSLDLKAQREQLQLGNGLPSLPTQPHTESLVSSIESEREVSAPLLVDLPLPLVRDISEIDDTRDTTKKVSFGPRSAQLADSALKLDENVHRRTKGGGITYRERLGGYLHPRDMRRLVTPFSGSNEPEVMVRRHVILLNCDPLRAIVLRDRLLVLVPDGADSILEKLSKRIGGGLAEIENSIFGEAPEKSSHTKSSLASKGGKHGEVKRVHMENNDTAAVPQTIATSTPLNKAPVQAAVSNISSSSSENVELETERTALTEFDEWEDLEGRGWIDMPFELQSVDAVLHTVSVMLADDVVELQEEGYEMIEQLLSSGANSFGDQHQEVLRSLKNEITEMSGRVQGFVRAINLVLDDDEDLALMNLSRLITHPEKFIQPVSEEVLNEESDEPELILEAYLQQALSTTNQLDLLKGQLVTTEEHMNMKLDTVRNRLLFVNTVVTLLSLAVAAASLVGSLFGMNLHNYLEEDPHAFKRVVVGTMVGAAGLLALLLLAFWKLGTVPSLA